MKRDRNKNLYLFTLYALFFLSGTSALVFENVWQRMMILVFGASASSTTAILSALFLGIAIGSWIGGRLVAHCRNVISFYAFLEIFIGVTGIMVPLFLSFADNIYTSFLKSYEVVPGLAFSIRFFMAVIVILPATMGMGATIPAMNQIISRYGKTIGGSVSKAYGINTLGAVIGCLAAGMFLVPKVGSQNTLFFAMSISVLVALCALLLRNHEGDAVESKMETKDTSKTSTASTVLIACYVIAGFVALSLEVLWMRILAIYNTNSIITFTLGLAVYLSGFSIGSLWLYNLLSKKMSGISVFRLGGLCVAAFSLLMIPCIKWYSNTMHNLPFKLADQGQLTMQKLFAIESGYALILMLFPAIFMGLSFPAACQALIEKKETVAVKSGVLYSFGNLGSMLGVLLTGLLLVPGIGLVNTFGALCFLSAVPVVALTLIDTDGRRRASWILASVLVFAHSIIYAATSLPFTSLGHLKKVDGKLMEINKGYDVEILRYAPGPSGTIAIREITGKGRQRKFREVHVDDNMVASTHLELLTDAKLLAHVPLTLHPDPKRALTVGFGSGGTSWSMTRYGIDIDVVEIEEEVINSAYLFESQNFGVLKEPNLRVILNDARDHLRIAPERYDVISTDVTNLQYKQNGNLYTREYFELMKSRLTANGIACAWIPLLCITEEEEQILIRTFQEVYPYTSFWYVDYMRSGYALLIGTPGPLKIDFERVRNVMSNPAIASDLSAIGITHPFDFINLLYMDSVGTRKFTGEGELHTDDRPILEHTSTVSFFKGGAHFKGIMDHITGLRPADLSLYVLNIGEKDRKSLKKHMFSSRKWAEVLRSVFGDIKHTRSEMISLLEKILENEPTHKGAGRMLDRIRARPPLENR